MHKGFKCLDVSQGRIYISRDVVFDECVFPFADLHPNAGAQLQCEILLLPETLKNPSDIGVICTDDSILANSPSSNHAPERTSATDASGSVPRGSGENSVQNTFDFMQFQAPTEGVTSADPQAASPEPAVKQSALDRVPDSSPRAAAGESCLAPECTTPAASRGPTEQLRFNPVEPRGSTPSSPPVPPPPVASPVAPTDGGQPSATSIGSQAADRAAGTPAGSSAPPAEEPVPAPPGSSAPASTRPTTRLQHGIRKPKTYTDGTVRYGHLTTLGEPESVADALGKSQLAWGNGH
jgi:hypothetical protein